MTGVGAAEAARARGLGVAFFYFETLWQRSDEPAELRQEALGRLFPEPAPRTLPAVRSRSPGNTADRPYSWGHPPRSGPLGPP